MMLSIPIILLVRPQLAENIGAAARAMSNFGLSELRLVAPRDGWPSRRALEVASGGQHIIENAKVFPDFASAIADIRTAYATTARPRDMEKRVVTPQELMTRSFDDSMIRRSIPSESTNQRIHESTLKTAFVFGPERTGLENEEIVLCDALITIPTASENSSLNLAQSVVIVGYEWFMKSSEFEVQSSEKNGITELRTPKSEFLATKEEWLGLFGQLEAYLDEANYYRVAHKKTLMWQNLQTMLLRGAWSSQEVQSFRGMLRVLWEKRQIKKR